MNSAVALRIVHGVAAGIAFFGAGLVALGYPMAGAVVVLVGGSINAGTAAFGPSQ